MAKHVEKLEAYKKNPDAFDNLGILKNASTPEKRQVIIDGRVKHLEDEIRVYQNKLTIQKSES